MTTWPPKPADKDKLEKLADASQLMFFATDAFLAAWAAQVRAIGGDAETFKAASLAVARCQESQREAQARFRRALESFRGDEARLG